MHHLFYVVVASALIGTGSCFGLGNLLPDIQQLSWIGNQQPLDKSIIPLQAVDDKNVETSK